MLMLNPAQFVPAPIVIADEQPHDVRARETLLEH
jgi:hypothetical protein